MPALTTVTGQRPPKAVETIATALAAPIVEYSKLAVLADQINQERFSGKQAGSVVIGHDTAASKWYLAVATGQLPADKWNVVELATAITPA